MSCHADLIGHSNHSDCCCSVVYEACTRQWKWLSDSRTRRVVIHGPRSIDVFVHIFFPDNPSRSIRFLILHSLLTFPYQGYRLDSLIFPNIGFQAISTPIAQDRVIFLDRQQRLVRCALLRSSAELGPAIMHVRFISCGAKVGPTRNSS